MHDTHEVTGSTPVSPTISVLICIHDENQKSKIEGIIIGLLAGLFAAVWLLAHWNLSRQPLIIKVLEALVMKSRHLQSLKNK